MKTRKILFTSVTILTTFLVINTAAYSQVSGLKGKFDGKQTQEARIREVGSLAVAIEVFDGNKWQQWYATRQGDTNISKIISCTVGDFNGDKKSDIGCLYDYGNFDVGIWVLKSDGKNFSSDIWWRSGAENLNPNALAGAIKSIDYNKDGLFDLIMPYNYPDLRQDIVFYSNGKAFTR